MNGKLTSFLKNFSYTLAANLISMAISALVTFVVPKALSMENYGYFQLHGFYVIYLGMFHFGWMDGIFLRYGGKYYGELDKSLLKGELRLFACAEAVLSVALAIGAAVFGGGGDKSFVLCVTALSIVLVNVRVFFLDILQCTSRMREYSLLSVIGRLLYLLLTVGLLLAGYTGYKLLLLADILGLCLSTGYGAYQCREILRAKACPLPAAAAEARKNIATGFQLLTALIASNLVVGVVRWGIDTAWDIETFARVSLTLSVSSLLLVFIRAVSLVLFPTLRRVKQEQLSSLYATMRTTLMLPILGMLVLYYPVKAVVSAWLPQYAESLKYMALLFPICVFSSKTTLLVETYIKVLRKETALMVVNFGAVALGAVLTGVTCFWLHDLDAAVLSIVVLLAFKCVAAELVVAKAMGISVVKDILLEIGLSAVFIVVSWYIGGVAGLLLYAACYGGYVVLKRREAAALARRVKALLLKK